MATLVRSVTTFRIIFTRRKQYLSILLFHNAKKNREIIMFLKQERFTWINWLLIFNTNGFYKIKVSSISCCCDGIDIFVILEFPRSMLIRIHLQSRFDSKCLIMSEVPQRSPVAVLSFPSPVVLDAQKLLRR